MASVRVREPRHHHFPVHRPTLRGVIHRKSVYVFATFFAVLLAIAPDWAARGWIAVHGVAICTMLAISAAYHTADVSPARRHLLRRLDHSAILLAIAGSYTGIAGLSLGGSHRVWWLVIVWCCALTGIVLRLAVFDGLHPLVSASFIVTGWVPVLDYREMTRHLAGGQLALILAGGVLYTAGAVILGLRRPNPWPRTFGFHEVFHTLVVLGAACHAAVTAWLVIDRRH